MCVKSIDISWSSKHSKVSKAHTKIKVGTPKKYPLEHCVDWCVKITHLTGIDVKLRHHAEIDIAMIKWHFLHDAYLKKMGSRNGSSLFFRTPLDSCVNSCDAPL